MFPDILNPEQRDLLWKDYVDLYHLMRGHVPFQDVVDTAGRIFGRAFNERLFREQLCYVDDIDFSESIDWMPGGVVEKNRIIKSLIELATAHE